MMTQAQKGPKKFRVTFIRKAEFETFIEANSPEEALDKFCDENVQDIMVFQNEVLEEEIKEISEAATLEGEPYVSVPEGELN